MLEEITIREVLKSSFSDVDPLIHQIFWLNILFFFRFLREGWTIFSALLRPHTANKLASQCDEWAEARLAS